MPFFFRLFVFSFFRFLFFLPLFLNLFEQCRLRGDISGSSLRTLLIIGNCIRRRNGGGHYRCGSSAAEAGSLPGEGGKSWVGRRGGYARHGHARVGLAGRDDFTGQAAACFDKAWSLGEILEWVLFFPLSRLRDRKVNSTHVSKRMKIADSTTSEQTQIKVEEQAEDQK